jgi:hypothetical protein
MTHKISTNIIRITAVFLLSVSAVHAGAGGSSSGGSSGGSYSGGTYVPPSNNNNSPYASPGIYVGTNSNTAATQMANSLNSGQGSIKVPPGYTAVTVAGNVNGMTYGVSIVPTPSSGNSNNNNGGGNPSPTPTPSSKPALGYFDGVNTNNCSVWGWAYDPDNQNTQIQVHVYRDHPAGQGGTYVSACTANTVRSDVNSVMKISGNHGFDCVLPTSYVGTGNHALYIHAIDISGTPNNLLSTTDKTSTRPLNCLSAPSLTLTADKSTYIIGQPVKLTWVPNNVSSCTATGAWSGSKTSTNGSHSQSITPTNVGSYTYTLSCPGAGVTPTKSVTVTVEPATDVSPILGTVTQSCTQNNCSKATFQFVIKNIGASIPNGVSVPYQIQYRVNGVNTWTNGPTGSWTGGIAKNTATPNIPATITGLTYSNYKARVIVNSPKNAQLGETNTGDNTSPEIDLSIAPNAATIDLQAADSIVRFGTATKLSWTITSDFPATCKVTGGGLNTVINHTPKTSTGNVDTPAMKSRQTFTVSCNAQNINGFQLPAVQKVMGIEVVPQVQEI